MSSAEHDAIALLQRRATSADFEDCIKAATSWNMLPLPAWLSILAGLSQIAAAPLDWLEDGDRAQIRHQARRSLWSVLTRGNPDRLPVPGDVRSAMQPFTDWIATQADPEVVEFCWKLLAHEDRSVALREPVYALHHRDRLSGDIALENVELALSFALEADEMFTRWEEERWAFIDWARDSARYYPALSHPSYLVRSSAAKALGALYIGCLETWHANVPTGGEILTEMGQWERKSAGIAGPFLFGAHWDWEQERFATEGFDLRKWFLDTLRESEVERDTPGGQTLEFHAHELFADDPAGIIAMLKMGRRNLALMTATQNPTHIDAIREALNLMANSRDPVVARVIQKYLEHPQHHAGTQFLDGIRFGNPRIFSLDA